MTNFSSKKRNPILTEIEGNFIRENRILDLPQNKTLLHLARENRKAGNLSEVLFWQQVRNDEFYGIDFDRQKVIGNYIVDFYVRRLGLVVEIRKNDNAYNETFFAAADSFIKSCGVKVYRITENDILFNLPNVMEALKNFIISQYSIPPRPADTPPKEGNSIAA
jgi:very-short-patch-repair endonuclease